MRLAGLRHADRRGRRAPLWLGGILLLATVVRLSVGFVFFGFLTGDDVEILQAGFLRALGWPYQSWEIRNLLVSDLLAAPAIALASALGMSSTRVLAWSASLPFVALASLNVWLVYRLAVEWLRDERPALLAAGLYAFHWIPLGFGSMVYPRTASTTCVLLATLLLWKERSSLWKPLLAGGLMAIAWAIRFSEAIFLMPLLAVAWMRGEGFRERALRCGALVAGFAAATLLTIGVEDWLTLGRPFASLEAFIRYSLVEGRTSSLATQPWYLYLRRLPQWLPLTLLPFLWRARKVRGSLHLALYVLVPLLLLSAIHYKQLRYLQGSIPFLILLAAAGAWSLWEGGRRRWVVALAALSLLLELYGMGFLTRKSMSAAEAAQQLAALPSPPRAICLSQAWAYGGTLYLGSDTGIRELPYPLSAEALGEEVLASCPWVAFYEEDHRRDPRIEERLAQHGYTQAGAWRWGRSRPVLVFRRP